MKNLRDATMLGLCLALLGWLAWASSQPPEPPYPGPPRPAPPPAPAPVEPDPDCPDGRCPPKRPRPWGAVFEASVGGPRHPDGTELQLDLPGNLHQPNAGGSDRKGLCVFASMRHSGLWADEPVFRELFAWMKGQPGGGWPDKVEEMIDRFCRERKLPRPSYIQVESPDLDVLRRACAAGLMPGVTYWRSPTGRYRGAQVSHMVSLVHADARHFVVLDNNYPGPSSYEWMSPVEFQAAYNGPRGKGWAIIPLKPGPPPIPVNKEMTP